jgi:DNA-binding transcriptional MerR regulator
MKTVTAIARQYQVGPDTIRHYTKLGLLTPVRCDSNGYRYFNASEEQKLGFVLSAKKLGFSLKEIREILNTAEDGDTPCPLVRDLIEKRLIEIKAEIEESQRQALILEIAYDEFRKLPDRNPTAQSICHLIETWQERAVAAGQQVVEMESVYEPA